MTPSESLEVTGLADATAMVVQKEEEEGEEVQTHKRKKEGAAHRAQFDTATSYICTDADDAERPGGRESRRIVL